MHNTGLAEETIGGLYEGGRLAAALGESRARTLAMYGHLDLGSLEVPRIAIVNLPLWELSHIAWFQEFWCLRGGDPGRTSLLPHADAMFNSSTVPHATRWTLDYPPEARLRAYMRDTFDATQEALARERPDSDRYFYKLAVLHEDMHAEALLMTLQTLGLPAPDVGAIAPPAVRGPARDVHFDGGEFTQGRDEGEFVFDNESHRHAVHVRPFSMASRPVTQGEYATYLEATGAAPPKHWAQEAGGWTMRRFDRRLPIDGDAAMVHVTLPEAQAYCAWAGRRLPTESEWEFAAIHDPGELELMKGAVWQWTSTPFAPYPGFTPGPYRDYSQPWFHDHQVLRGGSFATHDRIATPHYRNFYRPERGDPFAGFRTCAASDPGTV